MQKQFMLGNEAIARGAVEAGVKVVAGYPGTPATEIVDHCAGFAGVYAEWSTNEKHAFEVAAAGSLTNQRSLAVMKHNGTNAAADFLMHINFTGIKAGMVLISADDPGGLSSQCEEDTRVLIHTYGHLPVFDPASVQEAYEMTKAAYDLAEKTEVLFALRPVMRINHAGAMVTYRGEVEFAGRQPEYIPDRSRFVMSAVVEKELGGELRPKMRHRWLNAKQTELTALMEESPFNWAESADGEVGFIGCGIGYAFLKEAEQILGQKLPILKLSTLPLPEKKVLEFVQGRTKVVIFEEIEPVVETLIKELCFENKISLEILGRDTFLPKEGELSANLILTAVNAALAGQAYPVQAAQYIPARTRTQCVGCSHRGLLMALKEVTRKNGGVVTGDIGCHDAGTFEPMKLQTTIYCMGSSIPMAYGIKAAGFDKPTYALIGDSTFFHNGLTGLASAIFNCADVTVVIGYNSTTAMTGFQPHPGSTGNLTRAGLAPMDPGVVAAAMGARVYRCNPYQVEETVRVLTEATAQPGVKVVVAEALCYLKFGREGKISYTPHQVQVDNDVCNGCSLCVRTFGCPAITIVEKKAVIDTSSCNGCGVCVAVCKRGALK